MTVQQGLLLLILAGTLAAFISERWRYDVIALSSLMLCVITGLVAPAVAFDGLSSPAVLTVVGVLLMAQAVTVSGYIDRAARQLSRHLKSESSIIAALCLAGGGLSTIMNNVGALAIMMPIALGICRRRRLSPALVLMPLSFATLLGGMVTAIGTPPNLIISQLRERWMGAPFAFFDFARLGLPIALAGIAWLVFAGYRLIPASRRRRRADAGESEDAAIDEAPGDFLIELVVEPEGLLEGMSLAAAEADLGIRLHTVVRGSVRLFGRRQQLHLAANDIIVVEASLPVIEALVARDGVSVRGAMPADGRLVAAVITPASIAVGSNLHSLDLEARWGVEVVAAARTERRVEGRLADAAFGIGDVLLFSGPGDAVAAALSDLSCLPVAGRELPMRGRRTPLPLFVFAAAILVSAFGWLPPQVGFIGAALLLGITGAISRRDVLSNINWSIVIMLAALIPVGQALESTGTARLLAHGLASLAAPGGPPLLLALTLLITLVLTPLLNNAATVLLVAPIVAQAATSAGYSPDAFLMAIAIAASTDFLTPIGHHNNALIMGPGGYRFGDYWRPGLPLTLIVCALVMWLAPLFWPA